MKLKHKHWLVLLAVSGGIAGAQAQENEMERRMLACDALVNESDRLACFNNVVESLRSGGASEPTPVAAPEPAPAVSEPVPSPIAKPAAEPEAVAAPAPQPSPAPAPAAEPAPEPSPAPAPAAEPAPVAAAEPANEPEPAPRTEPTPQAPAASVAASQSVPAAAATADSAGSAVTQMPVPKADAEEYKENVEPAANGDLTGEGVIVRVWERHDGRFTVKLNNGQYWRETEGTRVGVPDVGDVVTVSRGLFGSYRMKIDGISRVAWVRPDE